MRNWILAISALLLVGLAVPAGAETAPARGKGGRAFWRSERVVERLALTPDQVEQLEADEAGFAARDREISERAKASRQEMQEALAADEFSGEKAARLGKVIAEQAAERSSLNTERQIAIRRVLSAEQWSELQTIRKRMEGRRGEGMDERMKRKLRGGPGGEAVKKGWLVEPEAAE